MSCLSGCNDFPVITPKERCTVVLSGDEPHCRCVMYEWSSESIGIVGTPQNYPIDKCDKLTGYSPNDYTAIYNWEDSVRLWLNRREKQEDN